MYVSPDCKWVASGSDDSNVKIWDIKANKCIQTFSIHDGPVTCLKYNPNDLTLATGSADKTVKYWDLENFSFVNSLIFCYIIFKISSTEKGKHPID